MSSREIYDAMDGIDRTKSDKYVQQVKEKFKKDLK